MFRIEKNDGQRKQTFTHNIYFKGNLISDTGYVEDGYFLYDSSGQIEAEEFLSLKVSDLPEFLFIDIQEHFVKREFEFSNFMRKKNKMIIRVFSYPDYFDKTIWNAGVFYKMIAAKGKKALRAETKLHQGDGTMEMDFSVDCKPDEKVRAVIVRAGKMFDKVYYAVIKELKTEAAKLKLH
ncbi:MAG: hypothetical protein JJE25_04620 [Bacteroidia bacterium]|nr:hypothetical protein [Bacteroidia bacterium]